MLAVRSIALAAGVSLAIFGFAAPTMAANHHHHGHHHHHDYDPGFGFEFDIPNVYIAPESDEDEHVAWCYAHRPNYDEDTDMYFSHHHWRPCVAPFD